MDGGALPVHEGVELIQEELLFGVREPAALASSLHAAHHVLLRGRGRLAQNRLEKQLPGSKNPPSSSRSRTLIGWLWASLGRLGPASYEVAPGD